MKLYKKSFILSKYKALTDTFLSAIIPSSIDDAYLVLQIELYPNMFNARITMAYTYWNDKKDYDKAEEWFESELQVNPNNISALCDLVALYDYLDKSRNAIAHAKKAINMDIKSKSYLLNDIRLKQETKNTISSL